LRKLVASPGKGDRRDAEIAETDAEKSQRPSAIPDPLFSILAFFSASVSASVSALSASRRLPVVRIDRPCHRRPTP
jgi:hypothetical protein